MIRLLRGPLSLNQTAAHSLGVVALMFGLTGGAAWAVPVNPDPTTWGADTGTIAFSHENLSLAVEQASISSASLPIFFGFYFDGTAGAGTGGDGLANAGIVFDPGDVPGSQALIDFTAGKVFDLDLVAEQSTFTTNPPGTGNIGFFISVLFPGQATFTTLYTDPALNGGFDLAATFPALAVPTTYLVAFDVPSGSDTFTFAYSVMLTNIRTVPEPATMALVALSVLLLAAVSRSRRPTRSA